MCHFVLHDDDMQIGSIIVPIVVNCLWWISVTIYGNGHHFDDDNFDDIRIMIFHTLKM